MISARCGRAAVALALAWLAALPAAWAQEEAASVRRATELREQPTETSRSLAALPRDTAVTRLAERSGAYVRVRTQAGLVGWVHLFDVGAPAANGTPAAASGLLRGVTSLFGKSAQRPTTVSTSTIGIRGLGAEDLAQAQPDAAAVARMEALRVSEQQARDFARDAQLVPVAVEPLPAPARPSSSNGPPGGQP